MMFLKFAVFMDSICNYDISLFFYNGLRLGGRFNAAKPLLYEVPTYLR
jgi:hypothetical protein